MRLLLDHNLSPRLIAHLADIFPDCSHVALHNMDTAEDTKVWEFARTNGYALVTKDADFADLSTLLGSPPQVLWLRIGNCTTMQIESLLRKHEQAIKLFIADASLGVLKLQ